MEQARRVVNLSGCQWSHDYLFGKKKEGRAMSKFENVFREERGKLSGSGSISKIKESRDGDGKSSSVEQGENRH